MTSSWFGPRHHTHVKHVDFKSDVKFYDVIKLFVKFVNHDSVDKTIKGTIIQSGPEHMCRDFDNVDTNTFEDMIKSNVDNTIIVNLKFPEGCSLFFRILYMMCLKRNDIDEYLSDSPRRRWWTTSKKLICGFVVATCAVVGGGRYMWTR